MRGPNLDLWAAPKRRSASESVLYHRSTRVQTWGGVLLFRSFRGVLGRGQDQRPVIPVADDLDHASEETKQPKDQWGWLPGPRAYKPPDNKAPLYWGGGPFKDSLKGDVDTGIGIDIDMDIDPDMDVSISWVPLQGSHRAPLKGLGVDIR